MQTEKQIILCRSEAERDRIGVLFPKLEARYVNGDIDGLAGRRVVALCLEMAEAAYGVAAEVKLIETEIPEPPPADMVRWARANAIPFTLPQNPQTKVSAPSSEEIGANGAEAVKEGRSPLPPAPSIVDSEPPPAEWPDDATVERPGASERPSDRWEKPQGDDWGIPENLWGHEDALPVLPPECYPDAIAAYVCDEAETMGCDPGMLALYCTAICAGATTDAIKVQVQSVAERWREAPRVWCMIVGDSGRTRKTPPLDAALSHAWKIDREMRLAGGAALKAHETEVQVYEAQKQDYIKKRAKGEPAQMPEEPALPVTERLIADNVTLESLTELLLHQGERGLLMINDELAGFFKGMNQYKSGTGGNDRTEYLQMWNGNPHAVDRKGKGRAVLVKNFGISLIGGTQEDAISRIGPELETDGMLQRFSVYLPRTATPGNDRREDKAALVRYRETLDRLIKLIPAPDGAPVRFSPEAAAIVRDAREWIFNTAGQLWMPPGLRSHLAKWPAMLARYCLTYAAIEAADAHAPTIQGDISDHIAAQVWGMMHGTLWPHAKHFYLSTLAGSGNKAGLRQIAGLILAEGMAHISTRTMMQRSSVFRIGKPPEQRAIVSALCELGWLQPASGKSMVTGIPTQYRVNPAVHGRYAEIAQRERVERSARTARWDEAKRMNRELGERD